MHRQPLEAQRSGQLDVRGLVNAASSSSLSGVAGPVPLSHCASAASLQGLALQEPPPCRTIYVRNVCSDPDNDDGQLQTMFEARPISGIQGLAGSPASPVSQHGLSPAVPVPCLQCSISCSSLLGH